MAKTYAQLQKEIEALKAEADKARQAEVADVVAKIREAIEVYGLTSQDLFGIKAVKAKTKSKMGDAAKYADSAGNTWVGRGPRPQWLRDAIAAGKNLEDFAVTGTPKTKAVTKASGTGMKTAGARKGNTSNAGKAVKYVDREGHSWSGRGPQPGWLKAALAAGKQLQDLQA